MRICKANNDENILKASATGYFRGESWYECPHCGTGFEYRDAYYSHGFTNPHEKVNGCEVFIHNKCGGKFVIW